VFCWIKYADLPRHPSTSVGKTTRKSFILLVWEVRTLTQSFISSWGEIKSSFELGTWLHDVTNFQGNQVLSDSSDNHFYDKLFAKMQKLYWLAFHFNKYIRIFNNVPIQKTHFPQHQLNNCNSICIILHIIYLISILLLYFLSIWICLISVLVSIWPIT
jgi:hypothetical protein